VSWDLRLGDCLGPEGLASLADKSVDHVICDPPYEAEAHTLQRRVKRVSGSGLNGGSYNGGMADTRTTRMEPLSFPPITEPDRLAFSQEAARVARRWVIVFCQAEAVRKWADTLEDAGLTYRRAAVWVKPDAQPQLSGDRPGMGYESMVCAHVQGRSRWNAGGKVGVYTFNKNECTAHAHPTQKPLPLFEALIRDFTDPGELILDPFAGSGTTGVACKRLGRSFLGWERDPKFYADAVRRLDNTREQMEFLPRLPKPKQGKLCGQ